MLANIIKCTKMAKLFTSLTNFWSIKSPKFQNMKWSNILLYCGLAVLLAGAIMSILKLQPYSDYVLVAGAVLIIFRGAVKSRKQ